MEKNYITISTVNAWDKIKTAFGDVQNKSREYHH